MQVAITITEQDVLSAFAELRVLDMTVTWPKRKGRPWFTGRKDVHYCALCPVARAAQRAFPGKAVSAAGSLVIVEKFHPAEEDETHYHHPESDEEEWANDRIRDITNKFDGARTSVEVLEAFDFPVVLTLERRWPAEEREGDVS